ncbi:RNA chaperone Hfq [Bacillus toyonensis]|uniref:RNA chaperone Hfq n=1 Tax=Bacillus toyonensis TaxID=155322 RepID=UPI000BFEA078|nr:RNA chaperone Hfq [Bacillus toyonensis]PHG57785.1 RNA chaperone Hfq [Bacillus toyonensis]
MERKPQEMQKEGMRKNVSLQDQLLQEAVQKKKSITLILVNGFHIKGMLKGYDMYAILLESEGNQQLVYKHAISTVRL